MRANWAAGCSSTWPASDSTLTLRRVSTAISRRRRGLAGYLRITCRELVRYRPSTYRLRTDRSTFSGAALLVTLANSPQFGNGARIAPGARLDDGRLDLVVFERASRVRTLLAVPRLFSGGVDRVPGMSDRADRARDHRGRPADDRSRGRRTVSRRVHARGPRPPGRASNRSCLEELEAVLEL